MIRHSPPKQGITSTCVAIVLALSTVAAQGPVQIHPPTGTGGPVVIAVLADNFTNGDAADFEEAAANFFIHGLLADQTFYNKHAAAFTVATVFKPVTTSPASNYGFVIGTNPQTNCSVQWNQNGKNTAVELETAAAAVGATHIVIIGNYHFNFGCQHDNWTYVAAGAVGQQVLHHEMGHLIGGLFDEFSLPDNLTLPHPDAPITRLNCSTVTPAHWANLPNASHLPHCGLYGLNIYHAFAECRMGAHGGAFCAVCRNAMEKELACLQNPDACNPDIQTAQVANPTIADPRLSSVPSPRLRSDLKLSTAGFVAEALQPASDNRMLRLLVRVGNKPGSSIDVLAATDATGPNVTRNRRLGDYVFEVSDGGTSLALGVVPGNPFETRVYGGGPTQHKATPEAVATVLIPIPAETRSSILAPGRDVQITFFKLTPEAGNNPVTPARLSELRKTAQATEHARLTSLQLREQLSKLQ